MVGWWGVMWHQNLVLVGSRRGLKLLNLVPKHGHITDQMSLPPRFEASKNWFWNQLLGVKPHPLPLASHDLSLRHEITHYSSTCWTHGSNRPKQRPHYCGRSPDPLIHLPLHLTVTQEQHGRPHKPGFSSAQREKQQGCKKKTVHGWNHLRLTSSRFTAKILIV